MKTTDSNKIENTRIEYKELLTKEIDLEKEIIAFLNYNEGGYIYIGINKDGCVVGVSDPDGDMLKIKDRIKHNILPSAMGLFTIETEEIENKKVIKITVASGSEKPYYKRKLGMTPAGAFLRVGTAAEPMPLNMIDNLYARRIRTSISNIKSNKQDLTFSQLKIYYEEKGKALNDNFKKSLSLLTNDEAYNYVGYLMADENNNSVKVAKFSSLDKTEVIKNDEYGYCSLIKIVNRVLDRLEIENITSTTITYPNRIDTPLWDKRALREAVINAFVHNDYSCEFSPTFEIYPDRLEIRSYGRIPDSMSQDEFFTGTSMPKNKELMRIFNDINLVETLGLGIPRIVSAYGRECFVFTDNFIKMVLPIAGYDSKQVANQVSNQDTPQVTPQVKNNQIADNQGGNQESNNPTPQVIPTVTPQVTPQVENLVKLINGEMTREELQNIVGIADRKHFREAYLNPAIEVGLIELTIPEKPNSSKQKYRLKK